jgi:hypothetical protein
MKTSQRGLNFVANLGVRDIEKLDSRKGAKGAKARRIRKYLTLRAWRLGAIIFPGFRSVEYLRGKKLRRVLHEGSPLFESVLCPDWR